jgi:Membrane bound O-acyl transferase family
MEGLPVGTMTKASQLAGTTRVVAVRGPHSRALLEWAPMLALPAAAFAMKSRLAPWEFMWLLAAAIFFGCKWQSWVAAREARATASVGRSLGYLLLWPGMDAARFLASERRGPRPGAREWAAAFFKTLLGVALIALIASVPPEINGLRAGWIGMLGIVLALHFGAFHLLSLAWQSAGVNAQQIMRAPLRASSLSDFWGRRWNMGFRALSHGLVYEPVRKRWGSGAAVMAAFGASGMIHDLVISVPAGAGYGLPTAYFMLQGAGVLIERSAAGAWLGIRQGFRGWLFALAFAAGPAYWLFHPAFVLRVMLPFFAWLGPWTHGAR